MSVGCPLVFKHQQDTLTGWKGVCLPWETELRALTLNLTLKNEPFHGTLSYSDCKSLCWKSLCGTPGKLRRLQHMRGFFVVVFLWQGHLYIINYSLHSWGHLFQWPTGSADLTEFSTWIPHISIYFLFSPMSLPLWKPSVFPKKQICILRNTATPHVRILEKCLNVQKQRIPLVIFSSWRRSLRGKVQVQLDPQV